MLNLKDTDTDDLFRRASEKYPLRTDSSDWDRMAAALEKDPPPPTDGTEAEDRRKKRRFFWLFLLLPLGGIGYYMWQHHNGGTPFNVTTNVSTEKNVPTGSARTPATAAGATAATATGATATNATGATAVDAKGASSSTTAANIGTDRSTNNGHQPKAGGHSKTGGQPNDGGQSKLGSQLIAGGQSNAGLQTHAGRQSNAGRQSIADRQSIAGQETNAGRSSNRGGHNSRDHEAAPDHFSANEGLVDAGARNGANVSSPAGANPLSLVAKNNPDRLFYDLQRARIDRNYQLNVNVIAPAVKKDSSAAKQKASSKAKTSYFYAGILGAPDLSTVKMQAVKGVGSTFGVLLGYAFGPHWAVETGAYLDRKRYYTEGQYFSLKEIPWPSNDTLNNVDGTCYMWEIPLNLRYTFNPGAKTRWFATAGLTTYLMTREKYTYNYEWYGNGTSWPATTKGIIKKPSQYPFSIVNLSAGFEQRLGKVGNLRIEPYLRIPLTGMGTGKLPIMSAGVNIGFTRELWKK